MQWNTMDWTECDLVECIYGKVSGVPLLKGTRLPAETIVNHFESGYSLEEIAEYFPSATPEISERILAYARTKGRALRRDRAA